MVLKSVGLRLLSWVGLAAGSVPSGCVMTKAFLLVRAEEQEVLISDRRKVAIRSARNRGLMKAPCAAARDQDPGHLGGLHLTPSAHLSPWRGSYEHNGMRRGDGSATSHLITSPLHLVEYRAVRSQHSDPIDERVWSQGLLLGGG